MSEMSQIDLKFRDYDQRIKRLEEYFVLNGGNFPRRLKRLEQNAELESLRHDLLRGMVKDIADLVSDLMEKGENE